MLDEQHPGELERYRLERKIGAGGMGVVYAARQVPLDRPVAVKLIHPHLSAQRPDLEERFVREASSLSRISHPSIVTILDYGRTKSGRLYIAMEYIEGRSLADVIAAEGPFSFSRVLRLGLRISRALSRAHRSGVIHRDLKPENIMLLASNEEDDRDQLKVLDFGLAKLFEPGDDALSNTGGGPMLGSPRYSSPEQIQGAPVDPRTDVYAVGVILYVMAAGAVPFDGGTPADIARKHVSVDPPPLSSVGYKRECPQSLELVIARCLAKRPEDRYASMAELIDAIKATFKAMASSLAERMPSNIGDTLPGLGARGTSDMGLGGNTPIPAYTVPPNTPVPPPFGSAPGMTPPPAPPGSTTSNVPFLPHTSSSIPAAFVTPLPSYAPPANDQNKTWRVLAVVLGLALSAAVGALLTLKGTERPPEPKTVAATPPERPAPEPAPAYTMVSIATSPPGATVRFESHDRGKTPTTLRVPTTKGSATLEFVLDGYETTQTEVMLDAARVNVGVDLVAATGVEPKKKKKRRRARRRLPGAEVERGAAVASPIVREPSKDLEPERPTTLDESDGVPVLDSEPAIEVLD